MDRRTTLPCALALALALAAASAAQEPPAEPPPAAEPPAPEEAAAPERPYYWLLEEFDWGDDEEVVLESIEFDPWFVCKGTPQDRCVLVSTEAVGEELLANFHHHEGGLWQVAILTPDLAPVQADRHLRRVWNLMVDYASKRLGEPSLALGFPERESLEFGPPRVTHFWAAPGLEARIALGRRDVDRFYAVLYLSDPVRGAQARPPYEATLTASDERKRERRKKPPESPR